ncbi:MAG TPA: NUDIX hydrolase [candidate division Zixibacteria bacterium]|nr:NUDIX hydrolase [candidate division Zixibacteria bacterium]
MRRPGDTAAFYGSLPAKRVAAGVLITDSMGRVLLVQPSYKPTWEIPGGVVEAGESPRGTARRELREELGLEIGIGQLLVVDWVSPQPPRTEGLIFVYDGGTLDDLDARAIRLADPELNAYGFVDMEGAVGLTSERLERRIAAALRARRAGRTVELEDGRPTIARELSHEGAWS